MGGYYASPVAGDGKVYFASDRGTVTVIDGSSATLSVLAHNELGEPIMATPALVDSVIYLRTSSKLYAFGKRE
jgi:outer membrane protein assembly factor BamB